MKTGQSNKDVQFVHELLTMNCC